MPTQAVIKSFSQVTAILQDIHTNAIGTEQVKRIIKVSETFLSAFKLTPDVFVAQPLLYKSKSTYICNLTFNAMVYCALICNRARINDLCCQQLLSCILTLYSERQSDLAGCLEDNKRPSYHRKNVRLMQMLTKANLETWLNGYQMYKYLFSKMDNAQSWPINANKHQQIIMLAHQLATQITPNKSAKPVHFSIVLKKLIQSCPESWLECVEGLLEYPTLICPGTVIKLDDKRPAIVLSVASEKVLVTTIQTSADSKPQLKRVYTNNIEHVSAAQTVSAFVQIQKWWDKNWQLEKADCIEPIVDNFPLDKPPKVLLEVQKHLNSGVVDIDKLAQQISSEPAFADYLKQTATFSNRNKLPVQQVKHGLMMHGYVKTNSMLIQQALLLRLNQSLFPLQQNFTQFSRLASQIAANLAPLNQHVSAEEASTLLCFACSGLFTQPSLKARTKWTTKTDRQYDITNLFDFRNSQSLPAHSLKLCQAWQQPTQYSEAISTLSENKLQLSKNELLRTLIIILGLSILLARRAYFSEQKLSEASQSFYTTCLAYLKIDEQNVNQMLETSLHQSHSYCALL